MTSNKLLSRMLKMHGFCVTWFKFKSDYLIEIGVKPKKTGCRCPHCGRRGKIITVTDLRYWEDVVVCGRRCILVFAPREINLFCIFVGPYFLELVSTGLVATMRRVVCDE